MHGCRLELVELGMALAQMVLASIDSLKSAALRKDSSETADLNCARQSKTVDSRRSTNSTGVTTDMTLYSHNSERGARQKLEHV